LVVELVSALAVLFLGLNHYVLLTCDCYSSKLKMLIIHSPIMQMSLCQQKSLELTKVLSVPHHHLGLRRNDSFMFQVIKND
jgi:hypothetical protein